MNKKNMTNPKTEHNIRKPASTPHHVHPAPAATPARQTGESAPMIEACDRLGGKLDEVAGLFREQIQAWRQLQPPAPPQPAAPGNAGDQAVEPPVAAREQPREIKPHSGPDAGSPGGAAPTAPADNGPAAMAESARSLVDTLARAGRGWPEQAAGLQQALEAVMAYLENQAAAPMADVSGTISRLSALEEQQRTLQSQINTNR
jgi:hypothetical protein